MGNRSVRKRRGNNNFFATRLDASEFQLSLLTTLPQVVGLLVLIPGGMLTDRMKNKRNMVMLSLLVLTMFYTLIGFADASDFGIKSNEGQPEHSCCQA